MRSPGIRWYFTFSIVFPMTSGHASWVRIWNMEKKAFGNMSNFSRWSKWQKSCIEIEPIITSKHIVKSKRLPNFNPGPNILYTKSSSIGEILVRRNTLATYIIDFSVHIVDLFYIILCGFKQYYNFDIVYLKNWQYRKKNSWNNVDSRHNRQK